MVKYLVETIPCLTDDVLSTRNVYGATALHSACRKGHKDVALYLVSKGASIFDEAPSFMNETPFQLYGTLGAHGQPVMISGYTKKMSFDVREIKEAYLLLHPATKTKQVKSLEGKLRMLGLMKCLDPSPTKQWSEAAKKALARGRPLVDTPNCSCPGCTQCGVLLCSRCKTVRYCSSECQKSHWKTHKKLCCATVDASA